MSFEAEVFRRGSANQRSKKEPRLGFVCFFNSLYSHQVHLPPHSRLPSVRVCSFHKGPSLGCSVARQPLTASLSRKLSGELPLPTPAGHSPEVSSERLQSVLGADGDPLGKEPPQAACWGCWGCWGPCAHPLRYGASVTCRVGGPRSHHQDAQCGSPRPCPLRSPASVLLGCCCRSNERMRTSLPVSGFRIKLQKESSHCLGYLGGF